MFHLFHKTTDSFVHVVFVTATINSEESGHQDSIVGSAPFPLTPSPSPRSARAREVAKSQLKPH